jgi:hypothetical protein
MLARILVAAFLAALSLPAYCQTPSTNQVTAVPDYVLYDHFLFRVVWLENQANALKAKGKSDTFLRSWMRVNAGLTAQEESNLKAIATDCEAKTSATLSSAKALASTAAGPAGAQQFQALLSQRQQTVADHVGQLQTAFGPSRYVVLDTFIRQTVKFGTNAAIPPGFVPKQPAAVGPPK